MSSCAECKNYVKRTDVNLNLNCSECAKVFHATCVSLQSSDVEHFRANRIRWACSDCESVKRRARTDDSIVVDIFNSNLENNVLASNSSTHTEVGIESSDANKIFEYDANNANNMLEKIYKQLIINTSQSTAIVKRVDYLTECVNKIGELKKENEDLRHRVCKLEVQVDKYEQQLLKNSIDIIGLPFSDADRPVDNVLNYFASDLGVELQTNDIEQCVQFRQREGKLNKIIVKFYDSSKKDSILKISRGKTSSHANNVMQAAKMSSSRNVNATKSGKKVFIYESLTKYRYNLFQQAKQMKKEKNFKYCWIRNSSIMLRKTDGGKIVFINNLTDLGKL